MNYSVDTLLAELPERISAIPKKWAAQTPDAPALWEHDQCWSYARLALTIEEGETWLRSLGVRPGDRVMIVGENCAAQIALIFALAEIDAWAVNVNARLSPHEIKNIQTHCEARRIIFTVAVSESAARHAVENDSEQLVLPLLGQLAVSPLNTACTAEPVEIKGNRQVATLIYTTGTTGHPKGVMLTHRNLLFIAATISRIRQMVAKDRVYAVLPMSHVFGLSSIVLGTLYAGASLDLAARYTPEALVEAVFERGITVLPGVPAMFARLFEMKRDSRFFQSSKLRFIYAGGAPLDLTLKRKTETLFGLPLHNGFGMTESASTISLTRIEAPRKDTSVGLVIKGVEIRLVDYAGNDVKPGDSGELWIRGPGVMKGYYREPGLTEEAMRPGGWLNTGDVAKTEEDGALFIVGRTKDLIIRSGFNVYPTEVEAALNSHPDVIQSAVVGRGTSEGNEEVIAFVESKPLQNLTEETLQAYLRQHLSAYKVPTQIVIMPNLPAAATGKILKGVLKEQANRMTSKVPDT